MKKLLFFLLLCSCSELLFAQDLTITPAKQELVKLRHNLYSYDGKFMNRQEYKAFLKMNCPAAYQQHVVGWQLLSSGIACASFSVLFEAAGTALLVNRYGKLTGELLKDNVITGWVLMGIGSAFELGCIPFFVVGGIKSANAVDTFNAMDPKKGKTPVTLKLNLNSNGVGLAVAF